MARPNRSITVHECFFTEQAGKIKTAISEITKKDSLSAFDTKAVRILTNVYDALISPVPENYEHHLEDYNNDRVEESQGI